MSKDPLSKIRAGDVWKRFVRVLSDFGVPTSDYFVTDKRPHPILTVTYCGITRDMSFSGTPSSRFTPRHEERHLRVMLNQMRMDALVNEAKAHTPKARAVSVRVGNFFPLKPVAPEPVIRKEAAIMIHTELQPVTMSSREIAELTGKRHDNVIRDIKSMLDGLGFAHLSFEGSYLDSTGRKLPCFNLPKRETLILVSGYDVVLRAKIIDRWIELEGLVQPVRKPSLPDFTDPVAAARAWADEIEKRRAAEANVADAVRKIEVLEPKAKALDRIEVAAGDLGLREAAAILQMRERKFVDWLISHKWIYRNQSGKLAAYSDKQRALLLRHVEYVQEREGEDDRVRWAVKVTPAGLVRLAKDLNKTLPDLPVQASLDFQGSR